MDTLSRTGVEENDRQNNLFTMPDLGAPLTYKQTPINRTTSTDTLDGVPDLGDEMFDTGNTHMENYGPIEMTSDSEHNSFSCNSVNMYQTDDQMF